MSVLVGDVIVRARDLAGDPCQTLPQPITPSASRGLATGIFNAGTYYLIISYLTPWGESAQSAEFDVTFGFNNSSITIIFAVPPPYPAIAMRVYFGFASAQELQYIQIAINPNTVSYTIGLPTDVIINGAPTYNSSAYMPDTDGDLVDASQMYRWMNAGLQRLGRIAAGILDQTGAAPQEGAAEFIIPGYWLRFLATWHNGWLTLPENQTYTWLQANVQGIPGICTMWKNAAAQVLGLWPQPSTAPSATTLTANMSVSDTTMQVASPANFTSPGMVQVDNEVMSFSQVNGNDLIQLVRPYGGTIATAHSSGATATQLIFRLLGRRLPALLSLGQSANTLDVPNGWDTVLDMFLLAQFKFKEEQTQEGLGLFQEFEKQAIELRDDQIPNSAKQIGGLYPLGGAAQTLAEIQDTVIVQ